MTEPLLEIGNLESGYGSSPALHGITLRIETGSVSTILGANGAGKTSLLRTVSGAMRPWRGTIRLQGREIQGLAPQLIARHGIAHVPEGRELFPLLSVEENLLCGAYVRSDRRAVRRDLQNIYSLFPIIAGLAERPAAQLSGGEQQMVAIGRALMASPRLLMLDEPSLGLSPALVKQIFSLLETLNREQGLTLLVVEQNTRIALSVADRAYLLDTGRIVLGGDPNLLAATREVRDHYLGQRRIASPDGGRWKRTRAWI